jgi:penicillin amidase
MDWRNSQAERVLPNLMAALDGAVLEGPAAVAHALLWDWQQRPLSVPERAAPLIFERWYLELAEAVFAQRLGGELWQRLLHRNYVLNQALDSLILGPADSPWWRGDRDGVVRKAFLAAIDGLEDDLGDEPARWRWDARYAVHLDHELGKARPLLGLWLNRGPYPWGGGTATVGRAGYRYDRPGVVNHGSTVRVVAEMTTPMRVWAVIPGGQSGHPLDASYDDQIQWWLGGRHFAIPARFEDASGSTLELRPDRFEVR